MTRASKLILLFIACMAVSCGDGKIYQEFTDFDGRYWLASDTASFQFEVTDTTSRYNVYCNIRNSTHYPYSRLFVNFTLADTAGHKYHHALLQDFLFDPKTGEPFGETGLGDLYDHQFPVLTNYKFKGSGPYQVTLEQYMRTDTLQGVLSVGLGVEKVED